MLIVSKVFTIFCLLCLCGNKEHPGKFLSKAVGSKLFFQMSAKVKAFLKWTRIDLSSKLSIAYGVMLTIIKVFMILFLLCLWEQGTP